MKDSFYNNSTERQTVTARGSLVQRELSEADLGIVLGGILLLQSLRHGKPCPRQIVKQVQHQKKLQKGKASPNIFLVSS